ILRLLQRTHETVPLPTQLALRVDQLTMQFGEFAVEQLELGIDRILEKQEQILILGASPDRQEGAELHRSGGRDDQLPGTGRIATLLLREDAIPLRAGGLVEHVLQRRARQVATDQRIE